MHRADFGKIAINYEGAWSTGNAVHDKLTTVTYDGSLYIALGDTTVDDVPGVSGLWALAAKGLTPAEIDALLASVTVLTAEGTLPAGQDTITLPWTYNPATGNLAVILGGVFQQRSSLTFVNNVTVKVGAAVAVDTPYMVTGAVLASAGGWNAGTEPTPGGVPQADAKGTINKWASGAGMPSGAAITLAYPTDGATYTAPADGFMDFRGSAGGTTQSAQLFCNGIATSVIVMGGDNFYIWHPVSKGEVVTANLTASGTSNRSYRFIYANGSKP